MLTFCMRAAAAARFAVAASASRRLDRSASALKCAFSCSKRAAVEPMYSTQPSSRHPHHLNAYTDLRSCMLLRMAL